MRPADTQTRAQLLQSLQSRGWSDDDVGEEDEGVGAMDPAPQTGEAFVSFEFSSAAWKETLDYHGVDEHAQAYTM